MDKYVTQYNSSISKFYLSNNKNEIYISYF